MVLIQKANTSKLENLNLITRSFFILKEARNRITFLKVDRNIVTFVNFIKNFVTDVRVFFL